VNDDCFLPCFREESEARDVAERAEFEERLRRKDADDRKRRHGGKHVEEDHAALDSGMDEAGKKALISDLRVLSEQSYLEKRQEKKLQVRRARVSGGIRCLLRASWTAINNLLACCGLWLCLPR
jgi:hypothetical protein